MLLTWTQSKPKLNKHTKPNKTYEQNNKTKKSEEPKLEHLPHHKNSLELDLIVPLSQYN